MRLTLRSMLIRCVLAVGLAAVGGVQTAAAIMCNGDGAVLEVKVRNDTNDTPTVAIAGSVVDATCGSAYGSYNTTCSLAANTTTTCAVDRPGIASGEWWHQISYDLGSSSPFLDVKQYQKSLVVFHASAVSTIEWTYFPKAIRVNRAGGDGPTTCPVNAPPSANSCDIRDAIYTAQPSNPGGGSDPILIMVSTSPGALNDGHISNSRANLTIDGTDANGKPWKVADPAIAAAGGQDTFSRVIEFAPDYGFKINNTNVTFRGLEIRQAVDPETGVSNSVVEIGETGYGFRLVNSRIDGMMEQDCFDEQNNCGEISSGIEVVPRSEPLPHGATSVQLDNSEIRSAIYAGIEVRKYGSATIRDSWLHNNYGSNVVAQNAAGLALQRSVVERSGLRASDDVLPVLTGVPAGVVLSRPGTDGPTDMTFQSSMSIYRNNFFFGVWGIGDGTTLFPNDDVFCGNLSAGIYTSESGSATGHPVISSGGGLAATYNGFRGAQIIGNGVNVLPDTSVGYDFNADSAFTANRDCGLFNRSQVIEIPAIANQWRDVDPNDPNDPPSFDDCESSGGGAVDTSSPQNWQDTHPGIIETFPSNALLANQTVRVHGQFFNAIAGNPLSADPNDPNDPGAPCELGVDISGTWNGEGTPQAGSCCNDATRANTCGNPIVGNCVQLTDSQSNVHDLAVKGVTPRLLEVELPGSTLSCIGGSGERVTVIKLNSLGNPVSGFITTCEPI